MSEARLERRDPTSPDPEEVQDEATSQARATRRVVGNTCELEDDGSAKGGPGNPPRQLRPSPSKRTGKMWWLLTLRRNTAAAHARATLWDTGFRAPSSCHVITTRHQKNRKMPAEASAVFSAGVAPNVRRPHVQNNRHCAKQSCTTANKRHVGCSRERTNPTAARPDRWKFAIA